MLNRPYLQFRKTYSHHTWQTGELRWRTKTSKVTWTLNTWPHEVTWQIKKRFISNLLRLMTVKLSKVGNHSKRPPPLKSTWSSDHVTDKKHYISTSVRPMAIKLDRVVGPNVGLYPQSLITCWCWSCDHITNEKRYKFILRVIRGYQIWRQGA